MGMGMGMSGRVDPPVRTGTCRLPDGRALGWSEWGPPDGAPVLLCPGAATGSRLGFGTDLVDTLGVRLVSADRPGLGASDPAPGRTLDDWARDVRHLAAERGLGRPALVGYSQGAPFALACAAHGLASAVAVVSGTDELASPRFADALEPEVRRLVDLAVADPEAAEALFAGFGSADVLWEVIAAGSSETDLAVYRQPSFETALRGALADGFARGPAGYARDTLLAMGRWPFAPADVAVPVDLWYGRQDTSPTHSPDLGAGLAALLPDARRHLVPGAGGALLWTRAEPVLRSLLERGGAPLTRC
ncbi:alpha/beta hydrolase [Streptomyces sp. SCUT-3]|uniref:alpha/beta fold hydrolase n=2 Tax=unclassified Streptomyces TaxID=2593676 RepID=UPI0031FBF928